MTHPVGETVVQHVRGIGHSHWLFDVRSQGTVLVETPASWAGPVAVSYTPIRETTSNLGVGHI
jgi:hypothetical protein